MTVTEWYTETLSQYHMYAAQERLGQFLMNRLYDFDQNLYNKITGTDADPFYIDSVERITNFLLALGIYTEDE